MTQQQDGGPVVPVKDEKISPGEAGGGWPISKPRMRIQQSSLPLTALSRRDQMSRGDIRTMPLEFLLRSIAYEAPTLTRHASQ